MEDITRTERKYLPFHEWPVPDRLGWEGLFADGDIFDDVGLGRHWRATTRDSHCHHYAYWLGWLAREGRLDPVDTPANRVIPETVELYAANLIASVRPRTAASAMIGLKETITHMAPERDWRWLKHICNRLNTWAKPAVDRRAAMRPVEEIHIAACKDLDRLAKTPLRRRLDRVAYRDALLVMILSACPVRLKNLSSIRVGVHLVAAGERWLLRFDEAETKNSQRLDYILPRHVGPYLDLYLGRVRPTFHAAPDCDALWLGFMGEPLTAHSIYGRIMIVTERLFGTPINPHLFRSCAATSLVESAPDAARLAAPLLGHRYFNTTERYYVKAQQIKANREISKMMEDLLAQLVTAKETAP